MKIDKVTRDQMKKDFQVLFERFGIKYIDELSVDTFHFCWSRICQSKYFPDDNPNVIRKENGERLFPFEDKNIYEESYPCGSNDTTLTTALKAIQTDLINEKNDSGN